MVGKWAHMWELARLFGVLGTIAFGGPAAHVAMMRTEVVTRRKWMTDQQFLDLVAATHLIPGPNSTELAIHIGHTRGGWPGLLVAGTAFILPAALIVMLVAWVYVTYGSLPDVRAVMAGIAPVVIAIVAHGLWGMGQSAVKSVWLAVLGLGSLVAVLAGVHELAVLGGATILAVVVHLASTRGVVATLIGLLAGGSATSLAAQAAAVVATPFSIGTMFAMFVKTGAVLFGSGYVLLAFLRADFVERLGWLTEGQLLDAIAVGQITPGPVFTTATFIGYVLDGPRGALLATLGIFLPAFVFVALTAPIVPKLRSSPLMGAVLDGVTVASLGLMAAVTWQLGHAALSGWLTVTIALVSLVALLRTRLHSGWLVLVGAALGWIALRTNF
ncbi:MAG: chromate efflux transporter [Acidimicrobiia bacterium]|nr:chromate efflux transporter [Acidimicrobiia bacterium]